MSGLGYSDAFAYLSLPRTKSAARASSQIAILPQIPQRFCNRAIRSIARAPTNTAQITFSIEPCLSAFQTLPQIAHTSCTSVAIQLGKRRTNAISSHRISCEAIPSATCCGFFEKKRLSRSLESDLVVLGRAGGLAMSVA
jgi:hypothetical protein